MSSAYVIIFVYFDPEHLYAEKISLTIVLSESPIWILNIYGSGNMYIANNTGGLNVSSG